MSLPRSDLSSPLSRETSSVAELVHGSSTTPSMPSVSSAYSMALRRLRSTMGRVALAFSASAFFTEVNSGR